MPRFQSIRPPLVNSDHTSPQKGGTRNHLGAGSKQPGKCPSTKRAELHDRPCGLLGCPFVSPGSRRRRMGLRKLDRRSSPSPHSRRRPVRRGHTYTYTYTSHFSYELPWSLYCGASASMKIPKPAPMRRFAGQSGRGAAVHPKACSGAALCVFMVRTMGQTAPSPPDQSLKLSCVCGRVLGFATTLALLPSRLDNCER